MGKPKKKLCPYCGSNDSREVQVKASCYVECNNCGASAGCHDGEMRNAILEWNRRYEPSKNPCMFCGSTVLDVNYRLRDRWQTICLQCGATGPAAKSEGNAVELMKVDRPKGKKANEKAK